MRQRSLLAVLLVVLLAACDPTGLPSAQTPTASQPTPTVASSSQFLPGSPTAVGTEVAPPSQPTAESTVAAPTETTGVAGVAGTAEPTDTTAQGATPGTISAAIKKQLQEVEADVIQVRGLKPTGDVPEAFVTQSQMHDNLLKSLSKDYPKKDAVRDATEAWLLRLLDNRSTDLYQLQVDLLTEQVAGYYDSDTKELFARNDSGTLDPVARETLAHEFVHSLQDDNYNLNKLIPDQSQNDDRDSAVRALVEGDANLTGIQYAQQYMSTSDLRKLVQESSAASTAVFDSAPQYIQDGLTFPYNAGSAFVSALRQIDGNNAVNAALTDPPLSTEQILHPEKYIEKPRDNPKSVVLQPLTNTLGTGWTATDMGTVGEFDLQEMLKITGASNPDVAAAGWGGGSYAFYQNGDSAVLYESYVWDSQEDANEFDTAIRETFRTATKSGNFWTQGGRWYAFTHTGDATAFVSATDQQSLQKTMSVVK
ncbi:MAG: hypothetical protein IVW55_16100 [Chloroflexi bacterium]|nr:hypothetical protein [Chloroflexota bacterium]